VKQVLEDIAFLLRRCAPSLGVCCATRGNKHQATGPNFPDEQKCQLHVSESMETCKVLADTTGGNFGRTFMVERMAVIINTQALGEMLLTF
jgi:hypothetical protein